MKNTTRKIQSNQNKLAVKAKMINLGLALDGCVLHLAVPFKSGHSPEKIAQGIRDELIGMIQKQNVPTVQDLHDYTISMQKQMEN